MERFRALLASIDSAGNDCASLGREVGDALHKYHGFPDGYDKDFDMG